MRIFILNLFLFSTVAFCQSSILAQDKTNVNKNRITVFDTTSKFIKDSVVSDTAAYVKTIVDNKDKYIGKPFWTLLDDLKLPPKSFSIENSQLNESIDLSIEIFFDDERTTTRKIENIDGLDAYNMEDPCFECPGK